MTDSSTFTQLLELRVMPTRPIPARKIKDIIDLRTATTVSRRQLEQMFGISKSTVHKYLSAFASSPLSIQDLANLTDKNIHTALLGCSPAPNAQQQALLEQMPSVHKRLADEHTNLRQIWREYRASNPLTYGYSQFTNLCAQWCRQNHLRRIRNHPWFPLVISEPDRATLKQWRLSKNRRWERAVALLGHQDESLNGICRKLERSRKTIKQ